MNANVNGITGKKKADLDWSNNDDNQAMAIH